MSAIYEARILEAIVSGREGLFHTSAHFHAAVYQIAHMVAALVEDASGNALLAAEAYGAAVAAREGEKPVSIRWCEQHRSTADPREGDCHWTQYQLTLPGDRAPALCVISPRQLAKEEA